MLLFRDMMGNEVKLNSSPRRIISTVPSQTELLYELGLTDEVVGITKFCVHPQEWFRSKTRIGGTKSLNIEKIKALEPDLILANKEENTREQIETLQQHFPVWVSDISSVADGLSMIRLVGEVVGREEAAHTMARQIQLAFSELQPIGRSVAYFIWYRPWMSVGRDTFIHDMLERCGLRNVFEEQVRYPEIALATLQKASPDMVLLSSEPFPFKEKHMEEIRAVLPDADVRLVDGEMFSWYGSRMLKAAAYLKHFCKPYLDYF